MKYEIWDAEHVAALHFLAKGAHRLAIQRSIRGGEIDQIAGVGARDLDPRRLDRFEVAIDLSHIEGASFPLAVGLVEDLDDITRGSLATLKGQIDTTSDRFVGTEDGDDVFPCGGER